MTRTNTWHGERFDVVGLLESGKMVKVCAPMVRYSKLPFRLTVKEYHKNLLFYRFFNVRSFGTDVCYTPMIMADSFIHSNIARDLEFQSFHKDKPVIVQFAAHNPHEFASAVQLVAPFVDGVDLNCGCPQSWAISEGIGAILMRDPQLLKDMISQAKGRAGGTPVSLKMRIFQDRKRTVELAKIIEAAGASWLTVHGRTRQQKSSESVDYEMISLVKQSVNIPVIANGDVTSLSIAEQIIEKTGTNGVMSARGLLENPALFSGYERTPWECIDTFVKYSIEFGSASAIFHHHLAKMTSSILTSSDHRILNSLSNASIPSLIDLLREFKMKYNPL